MIDHRSRLYRQPALAPGLRSTVTARKSSNLYAYASSTLPSRLRGLAGTEGSSASRWTGSGPAEVTRLAAFGRPVFGLPSAVCDIAAEPAGVSVVGGGTAASASALSVVRAVSKAVVARELSELIDIPSRSAANGKPDLRTYPATKTHPGRENSAGPGAILASKRRAGLGHVVETAFDRAGPVDRGGCVDRGGPVDRAGEFHPIGGSDRIAVVD